jgi:hypothetical protein
MKNKTLAIFGIITYILSVIASVTNEQGESTMPLALVGISGILSAVFIILATIRLWKTKRIASILLATSSLIFFCLGLMEVVCLPPYVNLLIILFNIIKVISLLVFIWVVSLLWKMEKRELASDSLQPSTTKFMDKIKYGHELARYLLGLFKATTILFVIGKIIGYFYFLSWWWVIAPFIINLIGAVVNYLDWIPETRIVLYTIWFVYAILRYTILRLVLWTPIFSALITGYCIIRKYGSDLKGVLIAIVAAIFTYVFTIKLSGRSPGMPD